MSHKSHPSVGKQSVLIFWGFYGLLLLHSNVYANDPYIEMMRIQADSVDTMEAVFTCESKEPHEKSQNIFIRIDPEAKCFKAKELGSVLNANGKELTWIDEYGQTSKSTWQAYSTVSQPKRRIDIYGLGLSRKSEELVLQTLRLKPLKASYIMPHLLLYPSFKDVELVNETKLKNNRIGLEYLIKIRPGKTRRAIYEIELSDGIKLHEAKIIRDDDSLVYEIKCNNHKKYNGIWIARNFEFRETNSNGEAIQDYKIEVEQFKINTQYTDDDFQVKPKVGDDIRDHILNMRYKYGQVDNELGTDDLDVVLEDAPITSMSTVNSVIPVKNEKIEFKEDDRIDETNTPERESHNAELKISETTITFKMMMSIVVIAILFIAGLVVLKRKLR